MRELTLRHLLSAPEVRNNRSVTACLFSTYLQMLYERRDSSSEGHLYKQNLFLNKGAFDIDKLFKENYTAGVKHGLDELGKPDEIKGIDLNYLPPAMPLNLGEYPREIVEQFAAVMGYMTAIGKRAA